MTSWHTEKLAGSPRRQLAVCCAFRRGSLSPVLVSFQLQALCLCCSFRPRPGPLWSHQYFPYCNNQPVPLCTHRFFSRGSSASHSASQPTTREIQLAETSPSGDIDVSPRF